MALQRSVPDDVVLIAGKGHEDYQIYGRERRPFLRPGDRYGSALERRPRA